ncbi:methylesterase 17 isoform X1 [Oryza sativa Japonica Group]|uniref:methylesterase 17 isoform X1 n=1 Tax=Oryza sativa subsp. japonica TaxID=39947 RepID=UPI00339CE484
MTYYVYKVINSTGGETQEQTIKRVRLRLVTNMHTDAGDDFSESCRSTEHFVLVHGAGHGAWCWFRLLRLLQDSGHRVSAVDLAGAAGSLVDPNHVRSFDDYNAPLLDLMASLPAGDKVGDSDYGSLFHQHLLLKVQLQINMFYVSGQPFNLMHSSLVCQVILIGHSAGGLSVVHAMHLFGDRIKQAIFIAATMLQFGYQTEQDIKDGVPDLSEHGDVYDLTFGLGADHPPTAVALRKEFQRIILYQQSPQEDSALASILLRPWPTALSTARFTGDDGGVESFIDRVRRVYIKTENDRMVQPEQQEAMIRRWPPSKVMVMDTDHSPFFSAPELLFNLILKSL